MVAATNAEGPVDESERHWIAKKLAMAGSGTELRARTAVSKAWEAQVEMAARLAAWQGSDTERDCLRRLVGQRGGAQGRVDNIDVTIAGSHSGGETDAAARTSP